MATGNPVLRDRSFTPVGPITEPGTTMTLQGAVNKTIILAGLVFVTAFLTMHYSFTTGLQGPLQLLAVGAAILGFIIALVITFVPRSAPFLSPVYAVVEGGFIGVVSAVFEAMYPGIVVQAILGTFGVMFLMLFVYKTGLIQVNRKFIMGVVVATGAVVLLYVGSFIAGFFGFYPSWLYDSSPLSIGISLLIIGIASLNLIIDFYFMYEMSDRNAPKYMEWYTAFGLIVTLVWLYLEILRLLAKLNRR